LSDWRVEPEISMTRDPMVQAAINTIRTLSIDAVQQAESGHPGTPMALAPLGQAFRIGVG
jgi:transketolase